MPSDPFYRSPRWRSLREQRLRIDNQTCTVRGCGEPASVVDHVIARRNGGADLLHNLRSLCARHDKQVKELPNGKRRNNGVFKGADASGMPTDPSHPFNQAGGRSDSSALEGQDRPEARPRTKFRRAV
jgi:5-methylcytosine-specific restriction enzyme A